jgi:hypothetical protein
MRVRSVLIVTAIVSSLLGAVIVYLVLTVPNDLQAGALLRQARKDVAAGKNAEARAALSKIVQQYPRTDAAAAATVALVKIAEEEQAKLQRELDTLRRSSVQQARLLAELQKNVGAIRTAPPPAAAVAPPLPAEPAAPPAVKPAAKKTPPKKAPAKKKPVRHSSRRRR